MNIKKVIEIFQEFIIINPYNQNNGRISRYLFSRIVNGEVDLRIKHAMKLGSVLGFDWTMLYTDEQKGA